MPRRARLRLADLPFHIIQRGNNRAACFHSDRDRSRYLDELATLSRTHNVAIHAHVLMTNHVHLLATGSEADSLSEMMRLLGQRYAQYFNRVHGRTGTLWEGRYRSCLVDSEGYLLTCHRYIECNPVRAGMVADPADYDWSSHRANLTGEPLPPLTPHPVVTSLGATPGERADAYRHLFAEELSEASLAEVRQMTNGGFALGSPVFCEQLSSALNRRVHRVGQGRRGPACTASG